MDTLRPFIPALAALVATLLVVGLLVMKLAGFGKDIQQASHSKRTPGGQ